MSDDERQIGASQWETRARTAPEALGQALRQMVTSVEKDLPDLLAARPGTSLVVHMTSKSKGRGPSFQVHLTITPITRTDA